MAKKKSSQWKQKSGMTHFNQKTGNFALVAKGG